MQTTTHQTTTHQTRQRMTHQTTQTTTHPLDELEYSPLPKLAPWSTTQHQRPIPLCSCSNSKTPTSQEAGSLQPRLEQVAKSPPPAKKQRTMSPPKLPHRAGQLATTEQRSEPKRGGRARLSKTGGWDNGVIKNLNAKVRKRGNVLVGMMSPQVEGHRVSDASARLSDTSIGELLLVLIYRRLIATKDTNLFNLMLCGERILSVDENPMPQSNRLVVGDPTLPAEGPAPPFVGWLTTAQNMSATVMAQVLAFARLNRGVVVQFLTQFRAVYPHFRAELQATYSQSERLTIEQSHKAVYAAFGLHRRNRDNRGNNHSNEAPPHPNDSCEQTIQRIQRIQTDWDAKVALVAPTSGIFEQSQLQCSDPTTINHGFKNVSLTTTVHHHNNTLRAFVKLGEPESSAGYSRASAQLRQALGIFSVPVTVVSCRISDPTAFGPPAKRGEQRHKRM